MELTPTWQGAETMRAFDGVAGEYHQSNVDNPILADMRERVHATLQRHVASGARVLDLGCGPGTDHPTLVAHGYHVTGVDASPDMVREATRRAATIAKGTTPTVFCSPIQGLRRLGLGRFDAVLSNFGPLNCVPDLQDVAAQIREALVPGGVCVASVIGRVCPWEIGLYLSRMDLRRATIRFRPDAVGVPLKDGTVWMRYLTPSEFARPFRAEGFELLSKQALGVVAPPPYLIALADRKPGLLRRLQSWDSAVSGWPLFREMGDHSLVVLRRR
ncbi:MAG: methyltransferase domain-containing protein [Vicinamibacterales bacterium]